MSDYTIVQAHNSEWLCQNMGVDHWHDTDMCELKFNELAKIKKVNNSFINVL